MDYGPRRVIALAREGFRREVLSSHTIWLCASCYSCEVHCPQKIHITDVMYTLKREAIREKMYPKRLPIPVLAQEFYNVVRRNGRTAEFWVVLRMMLRTNPLGLLGMWRNGLDLLRTGRLHLKGERIRHPEQLPREVA
jgi:heterodisulfide reductase subunit C